MQLITLQDEERADLARDLHDEIGPHLFTVNVDAEVIGQLIAAGHARDVGDHVHSIQQSVSHMQRLVRDILGRLRPTRATELGLNAAIIDLVAFWKSRASGIVIDCQLFEDETLVDETLKDTIYRVVQESLSNAVRHASARHISIRVERLVGDEIEVSIDDDGAPSAAPAKGGFGIVGMQERVKASGGRLTIKQKGVRGGWSISARLTSRTPNVELETHP